MKIPSFGLPILASAFAVATIGQTTPVTELDPFITSATRTPVSAAQLGSAVDVISAADLQRRQVNTLAGALGTVAGTPNFASGALGASASLFLRGSNSNQTLFLVDGIRLNDPNADYQLFLGGSCVSACDSLEVSHGPQSTLYGGEAMGGVIAIASQPGSGDGSTRFTLEAGSFGTVQGAVYTQGARGDSAYTLSVAGGHTDNDRPHNGFDSVNVVGRLDQRLANGVLIGATIRGFEGRYNSPGDRFTNDPDNTEERRIAERLNHQLVSRALALEGTCTGEHGVGLHKMDFLLTEAGGGAVDMMRTIKRALDPHNILNPGKIFSL